MRRIWLIGVLGAAVVAVLAGFYLGRGSRPPAGQPALVEINTETLSALQAEFNRDESILRVILLLSPT
jgi:hypothetical protein